MNPADVVPTGDRTTSADVPGPLLASGMSADVYALDDARVLRRYREGRDTAYEVALLHYAVDGLLLDLLTTSIDAGFDTDQVVSDLVSRLVGGASR